MFLKPPSILKLLQQELYQASREVIGQQEKVHRLKAHWRTAETLLEVLEERKEALEDQVAQMQREKERVQKHNVDVALGRPSAEAIGEI